MNAAPTAIEELRRLLSPERHEERLQKLGPAQRELYDRILKRREEIGPVDFDITAAIREMRGLLRYDLPAPG